METFSKTKFARREDFPVPLICVTTKDFDYEGFNSSLKITHDDTTVMENGIWKGIRIYG